MTEPSEAEVTERITAYLTGGGLFNPEAANHDAVRDLLIDCRAALSTRNRCWTCRWAVGGARESGMDARLAAFGFPMRCEKAQMIDTRYPSPEQQRELAARMCVTIDGSEFIGELYVKPDFGCVQWEPK